MNYLITYLVISVAWAVGHYQGSAWLMLSHILLGMGTQLVFLLLIRSNWNLRLKDPSMTNAQIVVAMLLITYLLAFAGPSRHAHHDLRQHPGVWHIPAVAACLPHSLRPGAGAFGLLITLEHYLKPGARSFTLSLVEWFVLACFLFCLSLTGSYIRELRERLQQRHNTLQAHQETLRGMMGQLQNLATTDALTGSPTAVTFSTRHSGA
ncbi:hypothetical protein ULG90_09165 [Halopseudomonas pachastrellae]|nr:hypothetical protein ULG90_09165 [Halopseudomonas pachastrellae]